MKAAIVQILKGAGVVTILFLAVAAAVAVFLGPAGLAIEMGSDWWLLLYTPHAIGIFYHVGR